MALQFKDDEIVVKADPLAMDKLFAEVNFRLERVREHSKYSKQSEIAYHVQAKYKYYSVKLRLVRFRCSSTNSFIFLFIFEFSNNNMSIC